jgi:hypothetical protein
VRTRNGVETGPTYPRYRESHVALSDLKAQQPRECLGGLIRENVVLADKLTEACQVSCKPLDKTVKMLHHLLMVFGLV